LDDSRSSSAIQLGYERTLSSAINANASALRRRLLICSDVPFCRITQGVKLQRQQ
jgi:hypothetical protein